MAKLKLIPRFSNQQAKKKYLEKVKTNLLEGTNQIVAELPTPYPPKSTGIESKWYDFGSRSKIALANSKKQGIDVGADKTNNG
ncbi:hypothetical protein [Candidatus Coxiella mudrowiae]|uniref:hypothetical protein n=1 Tax=Candidatus Coxiella mudrowiae TaxID=2054173 RepID=UPI000662403C|nr:hypothetical protein [Candidatus Coxiella mudrowiae]